MGRLLGSWGEAKCAEYLRKKGYKIRAMNYHSRYGEIDVIAQKKKTVVFVEVKLRKDDKFARAAEFVSGSKQEKILLTAQTYLQETHGEDLQARFDVVEIYAPFGISDEFTLNHIENAFE
ncbi:MAG: YraN family protein [Clostridia bacterium]|nr:YraN family protein [Clostridia bacterium]